MAPEWGLWAESKADNSLYSGLNVTIAQSVKIFLPKLDIPIYCTIRLSCCFSRGIKLKSQYQTWHVLFLILYQSQSHFIWDGSDMDVTDFVGEMNVITVDYM